MPRGSETHFKVVIVSSAFANKLPVARHQLVYGVLAEELRSGVHALTITSRTPEEWSASSAVAASPRCLGGSAAPGNLGDKPPGASVGTKADTKPGH